MSALQPLNTSVSDICIEAMKQCGALGQGQNPTGQDLADAWARLQWLLQQWNEDRYYVYVLTTSVIAASSPSTDSNGDFYFPVGPGAGASGGFETGANTGSPPNQVATSVRPQIVESAFLRQPTTGGGGGLPIDYPLYELMSREDYNRIALKQMKSFPGAYYYEPDYPVGRLYVYPVPNQTQYSLGLTWRQQLPLQFATSASLIILPFVYYRALYTTLALELCPKYGLRASPDLIKQAAGARRTLMNSDAGIAQLALPQELARPGIYNIFSDRTY